MRRTPTVRIYNGLPLPKFSGANKAGHACVFAALHDSAFGTKRTAPDPKRT